MNYQKNSFFEVITLCSHIPFFQDIHPWIFEITSNAFVVNIEHFNKYELIALGCFLHNMSLYCSKTHRLIIIKEDTKYIKVSFSDSLYSTSDFFTEKSILERHTTFQFLSKTSIESVGRQKLLAQSYTYKINLIHDKKALFANAIKDFVTQLQMKNRAITADLLKKYVKLNKMGFLKQYFQTKYVTQHIYELYQNAGGCVVFTGKIKSNFDWIALGKDIQKFWLLANEQQISVQPEYIDLLITTNKNLSSLRKELLIFHKNIWGYMQDKTMTHEDILFVARVGYCKKKIDAELITKEQHLILLKNHA